MFRKPVLVVALSVAMLGGCTQAQLDSAAALQAQFAGACRIAMASPWASPWVVTVCGTEMLVAQFALDPRIWAWVNDIAARVQRG